MHFAPCGIRVRGESSSVRRRVSSTGIPFPVLQWISAVRAVRCWFPVGYGITFRSQIKGWTVSDVKSLELTLSGVVPEVRLACGSRTEAPVRTALTRTTREEERYRSYIYVFGLDRKQVVLKAYVDPSNEGLGPVYIERDITDIVNKALDEAEQTGDPKIEFELELVPDQVVQEPGSLITGTVTVVGWDEVEGGDMGD